ncbi:EAL domain-containing protein (putative c-di-GMP-specific phosphodiesterase class I) [Sphaerotilus hippei]|uniref:EAL domain-containing protein (Putative c-di-GMP-specific phosphodiesterase class I) n=1 Tax=Sphaerotilus hippei TaxID=744406 RepID=A0A318GZZ7_9BURK|nr:EAL domain-containing protein [Sphaerotilus hippei]PXW95908.1 EAL domain-containing protein (putative c-di-GMP-specific phosphodiesterase class I) [Sphaerotilus hippei]
MLRSIPPLPRLSRLPGRTPDPAAPSTSHQAWLQAARVDAAATAPRPLPPAPGRPAAPVAAAAPPPPDPASLPVLGTAPQGGDASPAPRARIAVSVSAALRGPVIEALWRARLQPVLSASTPRADTAIEPPAARLVEFGPLAPALEAAAPGGTMATTVAIVMADDAPARAQAHERALTSGARLVIVDDADPRATAEAATQALIGLLDPAPPPEVPAVRLPDDLRVRRRLQMAFGNGSLTLRYQPQVDPQSGAVTGAEALLRWNDDEIGVVDPAVFLPIAEDCGLMQAIGDWVLHEACRQIHRWIARGIEVPRVTVNISAAQLARRDFAETVLAMLGSYSVEPRRLTLELPTPLLMPADDEARPAPGTLAQLQRLRGAGVHISLDGFGLSNCSLLQLRLLPLDEVKIDRALLTRPDAIGTSLVGAIIALAHTLALRVVAVGVETEEQLQQLREQGCDEFQGFLIAEALSVTTMTDVLANAGLQQRIIARAMESTVDAGTATRFTPTEVTPLADRPDSLAWPTLTKP